MRHIFVLLTALMMSSCAASFGNQHTDGDHHHNDDKGLPPWQEATGWPDRIVVTLLEAPQSSFAVTWRTDTRVRRTLAQIVEARDDARFDLGAKINIINEIATSNLVHTKQEAG